MPKRALCGIGRSTGRERHLAMVRSMAHGDAGVTGGRLVNFSTMVLMSYSGGVSLQTGWQGEICQDLCSCYRDCCKA